MLAKKYLSILFNLLILIFVIIGTIIIYQRDGLALFKWYTVLSNIFAAVASLLFVIFSVKKIKKNENNPQWVTMIRYFSTCMLTMTIIVVITILAPAKNPGGHKKMMIDNFGLYLHTLAPIFAIISLLVFEQPKIPFKYTLYGIIPSLAYACVLIILNLTDVVTGPYFFLEVKRQGPLMTVVWTMILSSAAFIFNLINFAILKLINKNK